MQLTTQQIQKMVKRFLKERIERYNKPMKYQGNFSESYSGSQKYIPL